MNLSTEAYHGSLRYRLSLPHLLAILAAHSARSVPAIESSGSTPRKAVRPWPECTISEGMFATFRNDGNQTAIG